MAVAIIRGKTVDIHWNVLLKRESFNDHKSKTLALKSCKLNQNPFKSRSKPPSAFSSLQTPSPKFHYPSTLSSIPIQHSQTYARAYENFFTLFFSSHPPHPLQTVFMMVCNKSLLNFCPSGRKRKLLMLSSISQAKHFSLNYLLKCNHENFQLKIHPPTILVWWMSLLFAQVRFFYCSSTLSVMRWIF
jgi:hypothetical protein